MPYRSKKHNDEGAVLLYTLCVGALLAIFSAMLLRAVGLLAIGRSSRLQEEEAWQQAVTLTDRLANELVAPETEYHRFVGTTFCPMRIRTGKPIPSLLHQFGWIRCHHRHTAERPCKAAG